MMNRRNWLLGGLAAAILLPAVTWAQQDKDEYEKVDLFQAIEDGQVEAKFIPKDSKQANLIIKNKTKKPLSVELPDAFAGVPVLGQALGGVGGVGGGFGGGGQAVGGGFGGGGLGGGAGGAGGAGAGGFFNVAPEKVGQLEVNTVCLEHGKPEPRAAMEYKVVPIEKFSNDTTLHEMLKLFATGRVPFAAAQAAAWNLSSKMSWQELAAKRIKRLNGASQPYFHPQQLRMAMQLVLMAKQRADSQEDPGKETSLSGE